MKQQIQNTIRNQDKNPLNNIYIKRLRKLLKGGVNDRNLFE